MSSDLDVKRLLTDMIAGMVEPSIIGTIRICAAPTIPDGWFVCDGRAVSRTEYKSLFDAIGTTYGSGDGSTTFNIPDLRDRFVMGVSSTWALNSVGGQANAYLRSHAHSLYDPTHGHYSGLYTVADRFGSGSRDAAGAYTGYGNPIYTGGAGTGQSVYSAGDGDGTNGNLPPFRAMNYIICYANTAGGGGGGGATYDIKFGTKTGSTVPLELESSAGTTDKVNFVAGDGIGFESDGTNLTINNTSKGTTYDISYGAKSEDTVPINLSGSDETTSTINIKAGTGIDISVTGSTLEITSKAVKIKRWEASD